ncbi:MAG: hypothetical protein Q4E70_01890 [Candidatus Saccharibacteria bacterium]|nr:hypothetical protein [Candidatus Saccharibacteria bacterium]
MGIHTSIYRVRRFGDPVDKEKTEITIFRNKKKIEIETPVEIREEFYFGKSLWGINYWFYRLIASELEENGLKPDDEDVYEDEIFERSISIEDIKRFLTDINDVLDKKKSPDEVFPVSKERKTEINKWLIKINITETTIDKEQYNKYFYDNLKYIKEKLEKIIEEDCSIKGVYDEYFVDIG